MLKNKKICHIVGAGDCDIDRLANWRFKEEDLIIAADGGFDVLKAAGIKPDILLGDFDSIADVFSEDKETGGSGEIGSDLKIVRLPIEKDYTDMFFAVEEGIAAGYDIFLIWGGTGGRLDHTVANLQLLAFISDRGFEGYLLGKGENITALSGGFIRFSPLAEGRVSVFSYTEQSECVSESGLLYSLKDAALNSKEAIGVSNEFIGVSSEISVRDGILVVMWTGDIGDISERGRY